VIAELLEGFAWKALGDALDLLQADDVGRRLLEIGDGRFQARLDAVDVPGGDLHGVEGVVENRRAGQRG
jgi:hypothetical protein